MATETKPLTAAELALYIGQECEFEADSPSGTDWFTKRIDGSTVQVVQQSEKSGCQFSIRPILRPISSLTEAESMYVWKIIWGFPGTSSPESIRFVVVDELSRGDAGNCRGQWSKYIALDDYLRSIGIDTRGWIAAGKALDKTKSKMP